MAPADFWAQWLGTPLWWLSITLLVYLLALALYQRSGHNPLVNPVALSIAGLSGVLWLSGTPYATYFEGAQFVHFLLGPATVSLALPLWENLHRVRKAALPLIAALFAGSFTAVVTALAVARAMGVDDRVLASLAPKSATAPVAIGISQNLGGSPTLTAVLVILTGIIGAVVATPLLNALGMKDWRARGFAVGVAAHGIGTARAFQVNPTAGAFAGLGMGLNAIVTAVIAPIVLRWFL